MKLVLLARFRTVAAVFVAVGFSVTSHAADPPAGAVVAAIQTAAGNYLTAVNGGGLGGSTTGPTAVPFHTDATVVGPSETFKIVWLNTTYTQFALQTSDGHYVTAVNGGGMGGPNDESSPIHTDANSVGIWERLTLNFLPNNQLTIKVPNGQFVTAVNGGGMSGPTDSPIHTDAVQRADWQSFTFVKVGAVLGGAVEDSQSLADAVLRRLNQEEGGHWTKTPDAINPSHLFSNGKSRPRFDPKTATADVVTQAALDFLTAYADLWQLQNPKKELQRRSAQPDWRVEFRQWNAGVLVFEAGIDVFFYRDGRVLSISSRYVPGLDSLNKSPKLSGAQANEAARKHLATLVSMPVDAIRADDKPMLGISATQRDEPARTPRLIYRLTLMFSGEVATPSHAYGAECEIDAHTGEVVSENYLRPLTAGPIR